MEKKIELLRKVAKVHYPISIDDGLDTLSTLDKTFHQYFKILKEYTDDKFIDRLLPSIIKLAEKLLLIHKAYINGSFKDAYVFTDELITEFKEKINICSILKDNDEYLYRSRTAPSHMSLDAGEMSHIPYKHRHTVGSNRFSAPGIPCLYLASSSYLCWLEAGRPSYNTFNVCAFKPKKKMNILDLTIVAEDLLKEVEVFIREKNHLNSHKNLAEEYRKRLEKEIPQKEKTIPIKIEIFLHTWLIALACGIKIKNHDEKNRAFKEEYIIPQLLLQSLIENQIDGIKYISTNIYVSNASYTRHFFVNYAFPAKGNDKKLINYFLSSSVINAASCQGVDSLRKDVQEISKFLNGLQDSLSGRRSSFHAHLPSGYGGDRMPYNSGSEGFVYRDSVFGEIERILINELRWLKK